MRLVYALVCGAAIVWACAFAIVASEDAALAGKYAETDQFLSTISK